MNKSPKTAVSHPKKSRLDVGANLQQVFSILAALAFLWAIPQGFAADVIKHSSGTDLTAAASWAGGTGPAPTSADVAVWSSGSLGAALTLNSGTPSWLGIKATATASDAISIGSGGTLTLGAGGIDMSVAAIDATISSGLTLGAGNQTWTVNTSRTFTQNTGTFTRGSGATLVVDKSTLTGTVTASPTLVNGIVGPWAIVKSSGTPANGSANGFTYATTSGGNVAAYTSATSTTFSGTIGTATVNYDQTGTGNSSTRGVALTANTVRNITSTAATLVFSTGSLTANGLMTAGAGTMTIGGSAGQGSLYIGANNELVLAAAGANMTINSIIKQNTAGSSVTVVGPFTVAFAGANTYTGGTLINSGTLKFGAANVMPDTSSVTVNGGATLDVSTFSDTIGGLSGAGTVDNSAAGTPTLTVSSTANTTFSGLIKNTAGTLALTKRGSGTLTISGANNTYSGTTSIGGGNDAAVLRATASGALGSGTIAFDGSGGTPGPTSRLELSGGITLANPITLYARNNTSDMIRSLSGNNTLSGTMTYGAGGNTCTIQSDADTLTLGTASATAIGGSGNRNLTLQGAGNGSVVGNITYASSLTKSGAGTWTFSGNNTYAGATTISQGILALSGSASIANTPTISVASGAVFDVSGLSSTFTLGNGQSLTNGTGNVNGAVATASGSRVYPAASGAAGTLTFNSNLSMATGGDAYLDLSTAYNSGNDQIVVGGSLTLSSANNIHLNALSGAANLDITGDYVLFSVSTSTTMNSTPVLIWDGTPPANQANYSLVLSGNNVVLHYSAATAPAVTAVANPSTLNRNQGTLITATVTPGSGNIASVTVNLTQIGGSSVAGLVLSGTANVYTNTFTVTPGTTLGAKSLLVTVTDNTSPTPLTGTYPLALTVSPAAQVWNGVGADDNWSSDANWVSGAAPVATESVTFAGTIRTSPNMDANQSLTGLAFAGSAGSFTIGTANSSTLTLTAGTGLANNSSNPQILNVPIAMSAGQTVAATGNITANGVVSGTGSLTKTGNGTLTLTAANTFTGGVFGKAGAVVLDSGSINHGGNYSSIGVNTGDNATMTLKNAATFTSTADFNVGDLDNSQGTLNIQDSAALSVSSLYIGSANAAGSTASGTVNQSGGSVTQTSSGLGTFVIGGRTSTNGVGIYNLSGGTLTAIAPVRMSGYGGSTFNQLGGTFTAASTSGGINLQRYAGLGGTYNLDGGTANFNNIDASVLSSDSTFHSVFNFNGGTLKPTVTRTGFMPAHLSAANVRNGGAIIDTAGFNVSIEQVLQHSSIGGDNATDGGLTKNGNGTLTLSAANTYNGGTTVNGGTLSVSNASGLGAGALTINSGGTVTFASGSTFATAISGSGAILNNTASTVGFTGDHSEFTGAFTHNASANNSQFNSATSCSQNAAYTLTAGEIIFAGNGDYTVKMGSLASTAGNIRGGNSATGTTTVEVGNLGTSTTLAGPLNNGTTKVLALTKVGSGTLTLGTANTYTGPTIISGGTLALGSAATLASTSIHVGSGATLDVSAVTGGFALGASQTLKGNGTVVGAVANNGTIAAGTSIGTLTFSDAVTMNSDGVLLAELDRAASPNADKVVFNGGANFGGTLTVVNTGAPLQNGDTFDLFEGTLSGTFATVNLPGGSSHWNTSGLYTSGTIVFTGNSPVSATGFSLGVAAGSSATAPVVGKFATDADMGDVVTVTNVTQGSIGTVTFTSTGVTYTPTSAGTSDSFTYTVSDGLSTATATVTVSIAASTGSGANIITVTPGSGTADVTFAGIPGAHYAIERSETLPTWIEVAADVTVPANGITTWTDPSAPTGGAFYRTRYVSGP